MLGNRPVWATIPTIGYSDLLVPLIRHLEEDDRVDHILLTVNLEDHVETVREVFRFCEPNISIIETWCLGRSIHHGWNTAIQKAREADALLAILNDDIEVLTPNGVYEAARLLHSDPSYAVVGMNYFEPPGQTKPNAKPVRPVQGSYRHYGVGGFAWVCDPHKIPTVPESLVWWGGDDYCFFRAMEEGYKLGIANHVHIKHVNEATAGSGEHEWAQQAKEQDRIEFDRMFPGKAW